MSVKLGRRLLFARRYRRRLAGMQTVAMRKFHKRYLDAMDKIEAATVELLQEVEQGESGVAAQLPTWWIEKERLKGFKALIDTEMRQLEEHLGDDVTTAQRRAITASIDELQEELEAAVRETAPPGAPRATVDRRIRQLAITDKGVRVPYRVPKEALANLVGRTTAGSPLRQYLAGEFAGIGAKVERALTDGVILGKHPREIAREISKVTDIPRYRAERIARTEILGAYREAKREAHIANADLVDGWIWYAQLATCCGACWAMHGTEHTNDEVLESHPNCRCTMVPKTRTWKELGFEGIDDDLIGPDQRERAQAMYERATEEELVKRFGPGKAKAIMDGGVALDDLVREEFSMIWGVSRRESTLREILGSAG